jgi:hypothetical protein
MTLCGVVNLLIGQQQAKLYSVTQRNSSDPCRIFRLPEAYLHHE